MKQAKPVKIYGILVILVMSAIAQFLFASGGFRSSVISISVIITLAAAGILFIIRTSLRSRQQRRYFRALELHGTKGRAVIRGMNQTTARKANKVAIIEVIANVSSEQGQRYPVVMNMPAPRLLAARYTIGSRVAVLINPEDAQDVIIDFRD
jgi:hypothetical protein